MKVSIINIGDELLNGTSVNTNATWMCSLVNEYGAEVRNIIIVGDEKPDIIEVLEEASGKSDLVLITGGLGPTSDDRTKDATLDFFDGKLIPHEASIANIRKLFEDRGMPLTERNIQQGWLPDKATIYPNSQGTAPGMGFQREHPVCVYARGAVGNEGYRQQKHRTMDECLLLVGGVCDERNGCNRRQ